MRYCDEVPDEFRSLPRYKRLDWYERKAHRYLPAWKWLEEIDHGMTVDELRDAIKITRAERKKVQAQLLVLESDKLRELRLKLMHQILRIRAVSKEKVILLTSPNRCDEAIQRVMERWRENCEVADQIESEIIEVCNSAEVEPDQFLSLKSVSLERCE